ncbi:MAG: hypothetical protein LBU85_05290 [Treponema sp.]|jgi:predicted nucleic-acid-binding protein|nr:hypothetical protein [Treponema sp.]
MPSLDTNCLLRWLLDDIPEQTALVTALVDSGENFTVADAALIETLSIYTTHPKLSFVDCYLEVLARKTDTTPLLTFDTKLANQLPGTQLISKSSN